MLDGACPRAAGGNDMGQRLEGKVALVTGGSRGIGRAIARTFAREGAAVVVNYTAQAEKAHSVVAEIKKNGGRAMALQADVSSRQAVEAMVDEAKKQFGSINILVNNAGILRAGNTLQLKEDDFDRMIAVNLKGIIFSVQSVGPEMIERRYGKIVNLSSIAGLATSVAETTPYAMTKAAVVSLTKRIALELGAHNINVNAIAPGFIRTEMVQLQDGAEDGNRLEAMAKRTILNRVGVPEDIANVALFLASDESSFMTGQVLTADGGRMDFLTHSH
jgi:3-oxoacyl-[acyl-carrier protein] reductase